MDFLVDEAGPDAVLVMAAIKRTLDPNGILNPGKIFK
jgi:D-lactate dehydrogenase (cytochrome)